MTRLARRCEVFAPAAQQRAENFEEDGTCANLWRAPMELEIEYHINPKLTVDEFRTVLNASGLGERRPVDDPEAMVSMLQHANLIVAGRTSEQWVGVARTLTDYSFVAYMSDLAVDSRFQRSGIGRELIRRTRAELGPDCKIVLLAAPAAVEYYPRIGFQRHPQAWLLPADGDLA